VGSGSDGEEGVTLINANALNIPLAPETVQCVPTSPPYYGLRDYGIDGQIGLEPTPEAYVANLVAVFREVWRVLRKDGSVWLNLGDSYATGTTAGRQEGTLNLGDGTNEARKIARVGTPEGLKTKDLVGIPWRVAFALQADGWYLRSDIIWHKPNPMPESVTDRPTKAHEYLFLLTKNARYYYDAEAIREPFLESGIKRQLQGRDNSWGRTREADPRDKRTIGDDYPADALDLTKGRNRRTVWTIPTAPYSGAKAIADYVGDDGKPYTASPDCPIHGHLSHSRKSGTAGYDAQLNQTVSRTPGNGNHHEQERASLQNATTSHNLPDGSGDNVPMRNPESIGEYRSEAHRLGHTSGGETQNHTSHTQESDERLDHKTDLLPLTHSQIANGHSIESHRTDPVLLTSEHDTASARTQPHTQSKLPFAEQVGSADHKNESSTSASDYGGSQETQMADHNERINHDKELSWASFTSTKKLYCTCEVTSTDHFATFPPDLVRPCVLAGSKPGDIVLDPFSGSGTVVMVAQEYGRRGVGLELNPKYIDLAIDRTAQARAQMVMPL
jgi:DNA modification methylase